MNWSEWQAGFLEAIADSRQAEAKPELGLAAEGLAVYRNNYRVGLIETLAFIYPVAKQIVGEEFFTGLAREYVKGHASHDGNLHRYGAKFGDFIAAFPPCADLPYLADTARLEWAVHRCYYAENAAAFSLAALAQLPQESWGELRFAALPGVAALRADWPAASIWLAHQPGGDPAGVLEKPAECALVWRDAAGQVQVRAQSAAEHAFCAALFAGETLDDATGQALALDEAFDLQALLTLLLTAPMLAA